MLRILLTAMVLVMTTAPPGLSSESPGFDHSGFDEILQRHVDDKGLVDYGGIADSRVFAGYVESLKTADTGRMSADERLAFWINAYNAVTIDKVIRWKPKKSVRESFIPGLWKSTKFFRTREHVVAGRRLSPDDIEHDILRKRFKDPRIHFALICASRGCPPLPRSAYTGGNVQASLDAVTREYVNSDRGIRIDRSANRLFISRIFDWFAGDFVAHSGSVVEFLKPYLENDARQFLTEEPGVSYLTYDWALNAQ